MAEWSKTYFNFKHEGFLKSLFFSLASFVKNYILGILLIYFNSKKGSIYLLRASGTFNALIGSRSYYRPKIN